MKLILVSSLKRLVKLISDDKILFFLGNISTFKKEPTLYKTPINTSEAFAPKQIIHILQINHVCLFTGWTLQGERLLI